MTILSMMDVAGIELVVGGYILIIIAVILLIGAAVTAVVFSLKASRKHDMKTEAIPTKDTYAEAPAAIPETDESAD